jgi:hypothetical protein
MAPYEGEPGPDPTKPYRAKRPSPMPRRVPEAFRSLVDEQPILVRAPNEDEAKEVATEVRAAVHWLKTWGNTAEGEALWDGVQCSPEVLTRNDGKGLDVRATPYVRYFYIIPGYEDPVDARYVEPGDISNATDEFWGCSYLVHPPEDTGLRVADGATRQEVQAKAQAGIKAMVAHRKKGRRAPGDPSRHAEQEHKEDPPVQDAHPPDDGAPAAPESPKRTVAVRRTDVLPARASRTFITEKTPRPDGLGVFLLARAS